jgi:hypothetical protein
LLFLQELQLEIQDRFFDIIHVVIPDVFLHRARNFIKGLIVDQIKPFGIPNDERF